MKKYVPIIFALLTFIFTFIVNNNVYMFGDDYFYVTFSQGTASEFWEHHLRHYTLDNGRAFVHFLASIFLSVDLIWWKIFNSLVLSGITYFGSKIASKDTFISGFIFFFGICAIDIYISRQSIYWLTGSFNYVFPIFLLLVYWYYLLKLKESKKYLCLICFLGFISSATVEQVAMMAFGLTLLFVIKEYIATRKLNKHLLVVLLFSLIGAASVILSPATFERYKLENADASPLSERINLLVAFLVDSFFSTKWIFPANICFILLAYKKIKETIKNKIVLILFLFSIPVITYNVYASVASETLKTALSFYLLLTYIFAIIVISIQEIKEIKTSPLTFTIASILLIGSQIMLIASAVYGNRNLVCGIFMFFLIIGYLAETIELTKKSIFSYFAILIIGYLSISNQISIANGYRESHRIENKNIEKIITNSSEKLILEQPDITYTWSMPYVSEYHEHYYKKYYNIENVTVIWE